MQTEENKRLAGQVSQLQEWNASWQAAHQQLVTSMPSASEWKVAYEREAAEKIQLQKQVDANAQERATLVKEMKDASDLHLTHGSLALATLAATLAAPERGRWRSIWPWPLLLAHARRRGLGKRLQQISAVSVAASKRESRGLPEAVTCIPARLWSARI